MKVSYYATLCACLLVSSSACARQREVSSAPTTPESPDDHGEVPTVDSPVPGCETYGTPQTHGELPPVVNEASGLVVSSFDDQILWLHNDSGDRARVYAVRSDGELLATVELAGVDAFDWEDMARGPCEPGGDSSCLYLGDVGDNDRARPSLSIHRIVEPNPNEGDRVVTEIETMAVTFADQARDCEAIVVDENAGVFLLAKEIGGRFNVFTAQFSSQQGAVTLDHIGTATAPSGGPRLVTGADYASDQRRLLVRTYSAAMEYRLGGDQTLHDLADVEGVAVPARLERQGESIGYGTAGYWHVSEGTSPSIHFVPCSDDN